MMKRHVNIVISSLVIAFFAGGCVFWSRGYQEPAVYDLRPDRIYPQEIPVRIGVFHNGSGAGQSFMLRSQDGIIRKAEERWIDAPDSMLKRVYTEALADMGQSGNDGEIILGCNILSFEFTGTEAFFEAQFTVRRICDGKYCRQARKTVKCTAEIGPSGRAAAMTGCVCASIPQVIGLISEVK